MCSLERISASPSIEETLQDYLLYNASGKQPSISLELQSQTPGDKPPVGVVDIAATVAFQCYRAGRTKMIPRADDSKAQAVAESTLEAGHHTTRMHANFTFQFAGVSRETMRQVFHDFPFYNSEEQSQRYVEVKPDSYSIPDGLTPHQREVFVNAAQYANNAYYEFLELLAPAVDARMHDMYPKAGWNVQKTRERLETKSKKIRQEVARYMLTTAQETNLYYTVSEISLLRLFRASQMDHFSDEARYVIASMITEIAQHDPTILNELRAPLPPFEREESGSEAYIAAHARVDAQLGDKRSALISASSNMQSVFELAQEIVTGRTNIQEVTDPLKNPYLADTYDIGMHDPVTQILRLGTMTFVTRLSHTAEYQRERHRRTPGVSAPLAQSYTGIPDYITPMIIKEDPGLCAKYDEVMQTIYAGVEAAIASGIPKEVAITLLPNAHAIRVVETGDLFDWAHRWKQRLCLLAQEEIFFVSVEQVEAAVAEFPELAHLLQAPCGLAHRAGTGRCPEGDRWCGKGVWNWGVEQYAQGRLI